MKLPQTRAVKEAEEYRWMRGEEQASQRFRFREIQEEKGDKTLATTPGGTFCVARGRDAFLSPHLGDLDSDLAYRAFGADIELYLAMLGARAEVIAHDLHPEYLSTKWALEQDAELIGVQHHHAHAAACLAEHGETSGSR